MLSIFFVAMLQASAPEAAPAPPPAPRITSPDWRRRASFADVEKVYPRGARKKRLAGRAAIMCRVTREGTLADCRVQSETPEGEGFGEAVLKLVPLFQMRSPAGDGQLTGEATVHIPIRFHPPD